MTTEMLQSTDDMKRYGTGSKTNTYTVSEAVEQIGFGLFHVRLAFMSGLSWVADAMEITMLSILAPYLQCEWDLSVWHLALLTTLVFLGFLVGCAMFGWFADNFGRKPAILISAVWIMYFGILSSVSPSYSWLLFLRTMVGLGLGGVPQNCTILTECSPIRLRGILVLMLGVAWALGSFLTSLVAMAFIPYLGWRSFLIAITAPLFIFVALSKWLPESSHFFIACSEKSEATRALQDMASSNKTELPSGQLQQLAHENVPKGRISDLFNREYRLTTILLWLIWFSSMIIYYGVILMTTQVFLRWDSIDGPSKCQASVNVTTGHTCKCSGLTTRDYTDLLWTSSAEIPGILIAIAVVNKMRRKTAMIVFFLVVSVATFLLLVCAGRTFLTMAVSVSRGMTLGAMELLICYTVEVYPTAYRAIGAGCALGFGRIGAMITPFIGQVLLSVSLPAAVSVYGVCGLVCVAAAWWLPIETKEMELKDE